MKPIIRKPILLIGAAVAAIVLIGSAIARRNPNPLPADARADKVLIKKSGRQLSLLRGGEVLKTYSVALGGAPVGQKEREGDRRTPEGIYTIDRRKERSRFHRALHVLYPTAEQKAAAAKRGIDPGGDIMIHGIRNGMGWIGALHRK